MKTPLLYDGDMGGDDLWAVAMLLAHRDKFDIHGIATVFGNVAVPAASRNVLNFLHWLNVDGIPVVQGAAKPYDGVQLMGDDAYGSDGVGGVILPESSKKAEPVDIADWYNMQVKASPAPITVLATGPATNLGLFAKKYPENARKLGNVIFMGGAIAPQGRDGEPFLMKNGENRVGNITPYAEFNAYCDPYALNILIEGRVNLTVMAADATQYMVLTPGRQARIQELHKMYGPAFHRMLMACAHLDQSKFGVDGPFIHDPNVVTYLLDKDLYEQELFSKLRFSEESPYGHQADYRGETRLLGPPHPVVWVNKVKNTDTVFDLMESSLRTTMNAARKPRTHTY